MYVCGLTPSAEAHLGHARSFLFFDVLRRYLVHLGYRVTYVRNVTDIDDRSIAEGRALGVPWSDVVARYDASFNRSMNRLHLLEPDFEPRVTDYMPDITAMIERLIASGHAYVARDGVYYAVDSFPRYGALSGRNTDELLVGARIAPGEDKRDPLDFALWKFAKPDEPAWASPWGDGRPGWHIECSAMSHALLGEPFDIHGGGYDLVFPHHENEIAQTEALFGPPMADVWMHGGLLQFDGKKMSKSLGNFEPLATLLERHDPQAIRFLFLQAGYRKPLNFTEKSIDGATTGLRRLQAAYDGLRDAPASASGNGAEAAAIEPYERRFYGALDDDMNTAGAVSVLFDLAAASNELAKTGAASRAAAFAHQALTLIGLSPTERTHRAAKYIATAAVTNGGGSAAPASAGIQSSVTRERASAIIANPGKTATASAAIAKSDNVTAPASAAIAARNFQIFEPENADALLPAALLSTLGNLVEDRLTLEGESPREAVRHVIVERQNAKERKDYALADELRRALLAVGVALKDSKEGVTWSVGV